MIVFPQVNASGSCWMDLWTPSGSKISTAYWTITKHWPWLMETEFPCLLSVRSSLNLTTSTMLHQPPCHATVWCTWAPPGSIGDLFFRWEWRDWSCMFSSGDKTSGGAFANKQKQGLISENTSVSPVSQVWNPDSKSLAKHSRRVEFNFKTWVTGRISYDSLTFVSRFRLLVGSVVS